MYEIGRTPEFRCLECNAACYIVDIHFMVTLGGNKHEVILTCPNEFCSVDRWRMEYIPQSDEALNSFYQQLSRGQIGYGENRYSPSSQSSYTNNRLSGIGVEMKWIFGLDSGGAYFQDGTYKAYFRDKWPTLSDNQIVMEILDMYNEAPTKPITVVWDDRIAGSMKSKLGDAGLPIEGYSRTGDVLDTQSGSSLIRGNIE